MFNCNCSWQMFQLWTTTTTIMWMEKSLQKWWEMKNVWERSLQYIYFLFLLCLLYLCVLYVFRKNTWLIYVWFVCFTNINFSFYEMNFIALKEKKTCVLTSIIWNEVNKGFKMKFGFILILHRPGQSKMSCSGIIKLNYY